MAVGQLGVRGAVRVGETRKAPRALLDAWAAVGYRIEQLPSGEDIRVLMVGIEVRHALISARTNRPNASLAEVVKPLGHAQADIYRGLRLVRAYEVRTDVPYEELGAL